MIRLSQCRVVVIAILVSCTMYRHWTCFLFPDWIVQHMDCITLVPYYIIRAVPNILFVFYSTTTFAKPEMTSFMTS